MYQTVSCSSNVIRRFLLRPCLERKESHKEVLDRKQRLIIEHSKDFSIDPRAKIIVNRWFIDEV